MIAGKKLILYMCLHGISIITWGVGHVKSVDALISPDMSSPTDTTEIHLVKSKNIRKGLSLCYGSNMQCIITLSLSLSFINLRHSRINTTESSFGIRRVDNPQGLPLHPG